MRRQLALRYYIFSRDRDASAKKVRGISQTAEIWHRFPLVGRGNRRHVDH